MEARYISSTYTTDIKDTLECNKWMTEKGAEGVSGYIAYAIFFLFREIYNHFNERSDLYA